VAYRADIEIGVKGASRLKELQERITRLGRSIDDANVKTLIDREAIQSVQTYSQVLNTAASKLREVKIQLDAAGKASGDYAEAISQYVTALGQSNAAQSLQNKLIADEIELRRKQKLAASGIRETTQYDRPIGPYQGSLLEDIGEFRTQLAGQTSPVNERIARIRAYEAAAIDAANNVAQLAQEQEQKITQQELKNNDTVFKEKLNQLIQLGEVELQISKTNNDAALKDFDRRLKARKPQGGFPTEGMMASPGFKATQKSIGKLGESLALGAGFPLLFGGGAGSVIGSALGSFVGTGFGGQILGGALGQILDQATVAAAKLGNAIGVVGDNFAQLREDGVYITAELEKQIQLAKSQGGTGQDLLQRAVTAQTGDVGGLAARGAAGAVNELQKAWSGVVKAVQTTLGIIAGPFVFALSAALRAVQAVFFLINGVATGLGNLINLIPGARQLGQNLYEQSLKGTAEYENQLATLDKQIKAEYDLVELAKVRTGYLEKALGASKSRTDSIEKEASAAERLKKFEQELSAFRSTAPTGTAALRQKALEQETQMRKKFAENEKQILLKDAQTLFLAIQDYNKRIAEAKVAYEQQYQDMVRQQLRAQADFDLQVIRKTQDARITMREQELSYVQKVRKEELQTLKLLDQERQAQRTLEAALSSDPERSQLINTVQTALENWRTGRMSVEEEARTAQEQAQLNYAKAQIQIERYKYDNALRIARANEDSQLKIARINEQIRKQNSAAAEKDYKGQIKALEALAASRLAGARANFFIAQDALKAEEARPGTLTPADKQAYTELLNEAKITYNEYSLLVTKLQTTFKDIAVTAIPKMQGLPGLTDTSGSATAASQAAAKQLETYEKSIAALQKVNGLKAEDLKLAQAILAPGVDYLGQLNEIITSQQKQQTYQTEYLRLLREGVTPALAEQLATINLTEQALTRNLDILIKNISAIEEAAEDPAIQKLLQDLRDIRDGVVSKAQTAREGVVEPEVPGAQLQTYVSQLQTDLKNTEGKVVQLVQTIETELGSAMSNAIVGLVTGAERVEEVLSQMFANIGKAFIDMATQIIAQQVVMITLQTILKALGVATGGGGGFKGDSLSQFNASAAQYAGSVSAPNLTFAKGGYVTGPTNALIGEGGEPEYVIPASKMNGAMARYSSGQRGSSVVNGAATAGGGGGSQVIRFESTVINNVEYVTRSQAEAMSRQAAKQGAAGGYAKTMGGLRNSRATRARVGMG
jgi:hypothetical protein